MDWARHSRSWPNSAHSEFVDIPPHRWHIQRAGKGPAILLLHGAGASTHSWAPIFTALSQSWDVIAVDLPGQGFSKMGGFQRYRLDMMSDDIARLLSVLDVQPHAIIGHSAGAAIAASLSTRLDSPPLILSINGAFQNFAGLAGILFPAIAKTLALSPMTGALFSLASDSSSRIRKLIESTGSTLSDEKIGYYRTLIRDSRHVNATLAMMANWSLDTMPETLRSSQSKFHFLIGGRDYAVPAKTGRDAAAQTKDSTLETFGSLGHLMHEEDPNAIMAWIERCLDEGRET